MAFQATMRLKEAFDEHEKLLTIVDEYDDFSVLRVVFPGWQKKPFFMDFVSTDNDNDVHVRVPDIMSVEQEDIPFILPLLNRFNNIFRPAKFVCDNDGTVSVQYDYLRDEEDPAASAVELHFQLAKAAHMGAKLLSRALKYKPWE